MRPRVLANALEVRPELLAVPAVLAGIWHAARLAVLDDLGQVHRHVAVDVEDLAVHDQPSEASDQPLLHRRFLE